MIDTRSYNNCIIFQELSNDKLTYWFDFRKKKFLHNIDTFYYSIKLQNDLTADSTDYNVLYFRNFFKQKYELLDNDPKLEFLQIDFGPDHDLRLNLRKFSFAHMYTICLEYPEWFDIFMAPCVPAGSDGGSSVTCEIVVQIRSYMLWMYGVHESFERSYSCVQTIAKQFHLSIDFCQENRIDYCWHSNYLTNPEKFFSLENFYKMRVDRFSDALTHTEKAGSDGFEIDYVALGKRSDKVFIRIYLKSKEVVEQAYKGWFFYIWLFNGLINRYDLYVYEECYKRRSWKYLNLARCAFYLEHGSSDSLKLTCGRLISGDLTMEEDSLQKFADSLTPKVNLVMNVEYQTMRRHSKSYQLLPLHDNSARTTAKRIYDYFDNRKLIIDYLTYYVFRLVESSGDSNKSRRDLCGFWKALRSCRLIDMKLPPKQLKLVREYSRKLNADLVKTRAINSMVTYGFYQKGINDDDIMKDVMDVLCTMNDNDMQKALRYKSKRARQLNGKELPGHMDSTGMYRFGIIDQVTGEIYCHDSTFDSDLQGDFHD